MKNLFFFIIILTIRSHANLITGEATYSAQSQDDNEVTVVDSLSITTTAFSDVVSEDNSEMGVIDEVVVDNPTTGSFPSDTSATIDPVVDNNDLDLLGSVTTLPEPRSASLILLGAIILKRRLNRKPSG